MSINEKKLSDIAWGGGKNLGGIVHTEIYVAKKSWFAEGGIKAPKDNLGATALADLATISETHAFLTGYGFLKLKATPKTGNIESASAGELDGKVKNNIFSFMIPGADAEVLGFERFILNEDLIVLVKEACGQYRQIGSECVPARIENSTHTLGGGGYDGKKGTTFEIHDFQGYSAPVYTGSIYVATESSAS